MEAKTCRKFQIAEQAAIISEVRTIIAPAGAALANLAFASPGADVLIFYPPSVPWRYYWHLATFIGYRHYYLHGEVNPESDEVHTDWMIDDSADFSVNLEMVQNFLRITAGDLRRSILQIGGVLCCFLVSSNYA